MRETDQRRTAEELPRYPGSDTPADPGTRPTVGPPRWLTVAVIVVAVLVVLGLVVLHLSGGLGPGLHGGG